MNNITPIEANEPHINIVTNDGNIHSLPVSVMERVSGGELDITEIDDHAVIIEKIISEWLDYTLHRRTEY